MGIFIHGKLLEWIDIKKNIDNCKKWGILQFLNIYNKNKNRKDDFIFGYEIEYTILKNDMNPALIADKLLKVLPNNCFYPEYANYMVESIPIKPFSLNDLKEMKIEKSMREQKQLINNALDKKTIATSLSIPWLLGTNANIEPMSNIYSNSQYCSDNNIFPDQRFKGFTKNIRYRKGKKVDILVKTENGNLVHMDCMLFGMGCSCLQATFQLENLNQARYIYDQFIAFTPIVMALTASTPIIKGKLLNTDCRWSIICQSVDDRTEKEMGIIPKSRFSSSSFYVSKEKDVYNDINFPVNKAMYETLVKNEIDHELAQHISHIFVRDPLLMYDSKLENDDSTYHFNNLQSSNWESVRLKLPMPDNSIGWRVEMRTMDVQLTEYENAAFVTFLTLLTKTMIKYNLNFYQPISQVDENMIVSENMNSVIDNKFWFTIDGVNCFIKIEEIINYCMIHIYRYLEESGMMTREIEDYLTFVKNRSNGTEITNAKKIRMFVKNHPIYKNDCCINREIMEDFVQQTYKNERKYNNIVNFIN